MSTSAIEVGKYYLSKLFGCLYIYKVREINESSDPYALCDLLVCVEDYRICRSHCQCAVLGEEISKEEVAAIKAKVLQARLERARREIDLF
ncbi:MAG: hypothetical protein WCW61_05000 [Patescibacteria group bacterium]